MTLDDRFNGVYVFRNDTFTLSCDCEFSFKDNGDEVIDFCDYHDSVLQQDAAWRKEEDEK